MRNIDDWREAGKIAAECLDYGASLVKKGEKLLTVAERVEDKICLMGAVPAFPVNISLNNVAAHYTPSINDESVFADDLVKLDVGVNFKGAIGDTATTIDLSGKHAKLLLASKEALDAAIAMAKPGVRVADIGKRIDETIRSHGFVPIRNLSGHEISENDLHAGLTVPNYDTGERAELKKGMIIAIEPFATDGGGMIFEGNQAEIFGFVEKKPMRVGREVMAEAEKFPGPFSSRWLARKFPAFKVNTALKTMRDSGIIRLYPVLPEKNHGLISQHEHTILVDDAPLILTKRQIGK